MTEQVRVALVGLGGYTDFFYTPHLLSGVDPRIQFVAGVEPAPTETPNSQGMRDQAIPVFPSLEAMYESVQADLVIIGSPIQFHAEQCITALRNGSHVLMEKPISGSFDEAKEILKVRDETGLIVVVGFQQAYAPIVQRIKQRINNGELGAPVSQRMIRVWPRTTDYYSRNNWAGKIYSNTGAPILDSPVQNGLAHLLHHMLYMLGDRLETAAQATDLAASLYRAHEIENYDTATITFKAGGADCIFIGSHATEKEEPVLFEYIFEKGVVRSTSEDHMEAIDLEGNCLDAGEIVHDHSKLTQTIDAITTGCPALCPIDAALGHLEVVSSIQSAETVKTFPSETICREDTRVWVDGLGGRLRKCYEERALL